MRKQWLVLLVAVLASAMLWGCGSDSSSGGSDVTDSTMADVAAVGITNCAQCHNAQNEDWLEGRHANDNSTPVGPHLADSFCGSCHNNLEDSFLMPDAYGVTARDVVGCESCHGGGSAHRGIGIIPEPKPGADTCLSCHASFDEDTESYTPMYARNGHDDGAVGVYAYVESGHADAPRDISTRTGTVGCNRCHSDEGAKLYAHLNTIAGITDADGRGRGAMPLGIENLSPIQCRTCHDPHETDGNSLLIDASYDGADNVIASSQYNTCNHCHAGDNEDLNFHAGHFDADGLLDRQINDTHYDDPLTGYGLAENIIEGYVIRTDAETACSDCHNVHSGDNTINYQWAKSRHGSNLLQAKMAAAAANPDDADVVVAAGRVDGEGEGYSWTHYDWDAQNRQACAQCHSSTGVANYLDDPINYVAADNDFSHLAGWENNAGTITPSSQNEMLYCWGCHSNAGTGKLRNPGATYRPYSVDGIDVMTPDVGNSNVCINCHGARGNVEGYALTANPAVDGDVNDPATNMSTVNPGFAPAAPGNTTKNVTNAHYLVASATLYAADSKIGYEYLGQSYAPVPFFAHDSIGLNADSPETGAGPCVACHMETSESHTFAVVEKDSMGVITGLNATSCVECHTGAHGAGLVAEDTTTENGLQTAAAAAAFLQEEAEGYHEALEILNQALIAKGLTFSPAYPYFAGASWIDEGTFGAAHNYNYLHHEPGAYAHNRIYTKRLIFDSIDWLDNGVLDGSITIDAATYPEADVWLASGAARP